jgi:CRP/FNR family cyclic AMP-dependent transcriptional regulator
MDREEGMDVLSRGGWLSGAPAEFRNAVLSRCRWERLEADALIQHGGEEQGELIGLADGVIAMRTILGRADTPIMHFARPVLWIGHGPIILGRQRVTEAIARSPVWLARVPQTKIRQLLDERPEWWRHFNRIAALISDMALNVAADLLIRDSERRCAAVLLRLAGRRFIDPGNPEPADVSLTQDELAGAANMSRTSVRTMLSRLAARGLIEQGYRGVTVREPAALRAFVDKG